jgi:eukaryotic-like serine/threonine-protein kinase
MPPSDDLVGRKVGHFRIVALVGEGGMGVVYKAFDERLHRTIALKVLPEKAIREESHRRRFLREARSAAAVAHPNVAAIHDVGEDEGRVFLAMEYVEGRTLREEMARGRLDLAECLRIARGIARALAKAHEKGIVHRDLKPDNVMLNEDREVKVLDFGLAKLLAPEETSRKMMEVEETELFLTGDTQVVGTPSYMSPEQATGKKVDARADLFSFGILLYEMVTGARPFSGETPVEILVAIARDDPKPVSERNPNVPPGLERVIARCLFKRPAERFASARDLVMALEALEAGRPVDASGEVPHVASARLPTPSAGGERLSAFARHPGGSLDANITRRSSRPPSTRFTRIRPGRLVWSVLGGLAVIGGVAAAIALRPLPRSPASDAVAGGEAERLVGEGDKLAREGRRDLACADYARASAVEPPFARAALAAALCHLDAPNDGRLFFRKAWAARATLDEGDAALLFALEPVFLREHEDDLEEGKRLEEAKKRFPNDPRLHLSLAGSLRRVTDGLPNIIEELDRSLALDPQQPYALELKSDYLAYAGEFSGALAAIDECLRIAPAAEGCLLERAWIYGSEGECGRVESDARRMLAIDPEDEDGARVLANALYAQGRPIETAREVLRRSWERLPAARRGPVEREDQIRLATLAGDFVAAEALARGAWKDAEETAQMADHGRAARRLVETLREIEPPGQGPSKDAAEVAKAYLDGRDAWEPSVRLDDWALRAEPTPLMLAILRGSGATGAAGEASNGRLTEDTYRVELARTVERWEKAIEPPSRPFIWVDAFALPAESTDDANAALAARERYLPIPVYAPLSLDEAAIGRVYLLAGRAAEALPVLERAVRSCFPLDHPLEHTHAAAFLGRAREATGDPAGACAAYDVVRARWGNAKPRSATATDALQRAAALGCDRPGKRDKRDEGKRDERNKPAKPEDKPDN